MGSVTAMAGAGIRLEEQLTVCICTRDRTDDLRLAIESATANAPGAAVVVSDDGGSAKAAVAPFARCRWQAGPARGLGANRNAAVAAAETPWVLFLDDDARIGRGFVAAVESCLASVPSQERGRTIVSGQERQPDRLVAPRDVDFLGFQKREYRPGESLHTVVVNATVWPTALFDEVRFDERLLYGSDEVDLSYSALAAGYRILWCPDAVNEHRPSPLGRADYSIPVHSSRLLASVKRHRRGKRGMGRAAAYCLLAPLHLLLGLLKREGPKGLATFGRVLRLTLRRRPVGG